MAVEQFHRMGMRDAVAGVRCDGARAAVCDHGDVAPDVNPDMNRKPSPIVLKVFQLRAASSFDSADFFSLQDKPENDARRGPARHRPRDPAAG